ncbi:MAG: hypothetical protein ABEJ65_00670 [bacterium]
MTGSFPFDVEESFYQDTITNLEKETSYSREEIKRGITFMLGRRTGELLQSLSSMEDDNLLEELEIAIQHSGEEK